jgi:hypothetical protein
MYGYSTEISSVEIIGVKEMRKMDYEMHLYGTSKDLSTGPSKWVLLNKIL